MGTLMNDFDSFVLERMDAGDDPNDIAAGIEAAIARRGDWVLYVDGTWRLDTVCPKCGSTWAGVCGGATDSESWGVPCSTEPPILRREYMAKHESAQSVDAVARAVTNQAEPPTRDSNS